MADSSQALLLRRSMVETQIRQRGMEDLFVLEAMLKVPREKFVPGTPLEDAYGDFPIAIGNGQTISQPYIVALMTSLLQPESGQRILEIGTGSGYQSAVLAELVEHVYTVEILEQLSLNAQTLLRKQGYRNISFKVGNGWKGWPEEGPFDGIVVTAAPKKIPLELVQQLKPGGRLVIPVGELDQNLMLVTKTSSGIREKFIIPVRFVPMVE